MNSIVTVVLVSTVTAILEHFLEDDVKIMWVRILGMTAIAYISVSGIIKVITLLQICFLLVQKSVFV